MGRVESDLGLIELKPDSITKIKGPIRKKIRIIFLKIFCDIK